MQALILPQGLIKLAMVDRMIYKAKTVILAVDNLFFSTRISSGLRQRGYSVEAAATLDGIKSKTGPETAAVVLDLSASNLDVMGMIQGLKSAPETARIPLIGFGGHKATELFQAARDRGCDLIVTNAAITSDLGACLAKVNEINRGDI